jgi:polyisoprenoid-binding protein YceI
MSAAEPSAVAASLPAGTWIVDPAHSSLEFQIKHLRIATVKGHFNEFEGTLEVSRDGVRAYGTALVASVDTRQPQRDEHLRSASFFDAEAYPEIAFRSTVIRQLGQDAFEVAGELTIRDVTRTVVFDATLGGSGVDPQGNERIGLSAAAHISRSEYGVSFNIAIGSDLAVGDDVKIVLDVSAVKAV